MNFKLKDEWQQLEPRKQKMAIIVGVVVGGFLLLSLIPEKERRQAPVAATPVEVDILGNDDGSADINAVIQRLKVMEEQQSGYDRNYAQLMRRVQNLQNSLAAATQLKDNPEQIGQLVDEMNRIKRDMDEFLEVGGRQGQRSSSAPVMVLGGDQDSSGGATNSGESTTSNDLSNPFSDVGDGDVGPITSYDPLKSIKGSITAGEDKSDKGSGFNFMRDSSFDRPPPTIVIDEGVEQARRPARSGGKRPGQSSRDSRGEVLADNENPQIYIPSGSMMEGVLLTGMDAPTGNGSASEPYPVTIRLTSLAHLPNRFTTNVRECLVLAAGFGRLDSERVHLRTEMMSCILNDNSVIDMPIEGYITGEDGKVGLRGTVVERTGQLLMRAGLAGLGSGLSEAMEPQRVQSVQTGATAGGIQFEPPDTSDVLTVGAYAGAATAMEKLADYYLKRADEIFPIIEVDAMRVVGIHLTKGATMRPLDGSVYGPLAQNENTR